MHLDVSTPLFALERGQVITLDDAAGTCIGARYGAVWVTEEGRYEDHVLGPGESYTVAAEGRTLVQALQPAWVVLREAPCN